MAAAARDEADALKARLDALEAKAAKPKSTKP
jgi:BMFP domain-containing protein YqiC